MLIDDPALNIQTPTAFGAESSRRDNWAVVVTMNALQCLRVAARPAMSSASLLRPLAQQPRIALQWYTPRPPLLQQFLTPPSRSISLLSPRRPILPCTSSPQALAAPGAASTSLLPSPSTLDLAGKISAHPALCSMQIRCGPRDTYNPSHLVRKRRHGFLSRIRTKKGRKLLMRRLKKGRWNLSH